MKRFWRYKGDHILFWMITVLFYAYVRSGLLHTAGLGYYLSDILVRNGLIAIACYVNIYGLSPKYLKKGFYTGYFLASVSCLFLFTGIKIILDFCLHNLTSYNPPKQTLFYQAYYNFSILLFYVVFTMALETSKQWFKQQVTMKRIQMENLQTELRFLKAQMNPHFLFNSINTIYFQIDRRNTAARLSLEKFAELLRYQLYECNEDTISIEREVEYLRNYIDLQRLRRNENDSIQFDAGEEVKGFALAPLLLLPFVENAFKHVSAFDEQSAYVDVRLNRLNGHFFFGVSNSKNNAETKKEYKGIGLKNVRRRLDLLYADKYELAINDSGHCYKVNLKIQLQ